MSDILCVTSRSLCREDFLTRLERIAAAGPAGVILREKDLPPEDYRALAERALALCRARGVPCILHSFPETAEALGERAIHLPLPLLRALPPERRRQASIIRAQSQAIRDLVNDLNLTMRLDSDMQALRREPLQPAPFLRQLTADFLNSGMAEGYPVEVDLPGEGLPSMEADAFLLRRAVNNLLSNCVRHNSPGCPIALGARAEDGCVVF